ncbi:MAG: hypothetical protein JXB10_18740 [Pirellulales bacterium]|nr:hypothetical protein [Pirellulales bacterium]
MSIDSPENTSPDPGYSGVRDYLLFGLSLPERALRSGAGMIGGALRESAVLLVPQAFQDSKTYQVLIRQTLDFMAEDLGGVERKEDPAAPPKIENFVARKAVGNFIEMAGWATLHVSPFLVLAVVSDVAYGSKAYLKELAQDLKREGIIAEDSTIDRADDLLAAVAATARTTATAFDTPPLSVSGLQETIDQTRQAVQTMDVRKVLPQAEVQRLWEEIRQTAANQGVDPLAVSSAMTLFALDKVATLGQGALSTVRVAGSLLDRTVLEHYRAALADVRSKGLYASLAESSQPYIDALWQNFSSRRTTVTEDLLSGKLFGKAAKAVRQWLGGEAAPAAEDKGL